MPIFEADHLRKAFIGGRWAEPVNGGVEHDIINPATGEVSGALLFSDEADVSLAAQARDAFAAFANTPLVERLAMLERVIAAYTERLQDMADAITLEMGAPMDAISRPLQAALALAPSYDPGSGEAVSVRTHPGHVADREGAGGGVRVDHAMELADEGLVQGGAGAGGGLHDRVEAESECAVLGDCSRRDPREGRRTSRRIQSRAEPGSAGPSRPARSSTWCR